MADFSWMAQVESLSPAALTVQAQVLSPNDNGRLLWDIFFPRVDVDSIRLSEINTLDDRAAADRREWNARGRLIPVLTPAQRKLEMVPIEAYDKIDEKEMQFLMEGTFGANQAIIEQVIGVRLPARTDRLAMADYRRLELDAMSAWSTGTIIQRNPQNAAQTFTVSFGFDAARLATASPTWAAAANAYDAFLQWFEDGVEACGPGEGAMMRLATYKEILADAPDLANGVKMTRSQLVDRIQQDLGSPFQFFINETSLDVFTDGGTVVTRTKVWPAEQVAFIPAGRAVGKTAFAPVVRAMELSAQVPEASIDVRGVTIYHDADNGSRELEIDAQLNAMPVPDEGKVWVVDAGV
jgi:hypothetical protein